VSGQEAAGEPGLNAAAIVAALNRHQVRHVVTVAFTAIAPAARVVSPDLLDAFPMGRRSDPARPASW